MSTALALFRCRNKVFLATDKQMVDEHMNSAAKTKAPVNEMPKGSVILHNNEPYSIDDLTKLLKKRAKQVKLDINKPFSIIIDDRFIK